MDEALQNATYWATVAQVLCAGEAKKFLGKTSAKLSTRHYPTSRRSSNV